MPPPEKPEAAARPRLATLDQLRGYAIAGMILVNHLGWFNAMPETFRHHSDSYSYADTIAPLFIFVSGMGLRISYLRRTKREGALDAHLDCLGRYALLTIVGIAFYGAGWHSWWDALVDIGIAGILAVPLISCSVRIRLVGAAAYLVLYQLLYTYAGYGTWTMQNFPDGGPLGPLSWAFSLIFGTHAYDLLAGGDRKKLIRESLFWCVLLVALGWGFRAEWGTVKAFWPFSQRGMTMPYTLYSTGLCYAAFLAFYFLCEGWKVQLPFLSTMGENALILYMAHSVLIDHNQYLARDCPAWQAAISFIVLFFACYAIAWRLHRDRIIIKI